MTAYRVVEPSGSNGSIQFAVDGDFSSSPTLVFVTGSDRLGVGTSSPEARLHISGSTIFDATTSGLHQITGSAVFATGLSGSLTRLPDGRSYLVAGANVAIVTSSDGQVTISASGAGGGGGDSYWTSTVAGQISTTGSVLIGTASSPTSQLFVNGINITPIASGVIVPGGTLSDTVLLNLSSSVPNNQYSSFNIDVVGSTKGVLTLAGIATAKWMLSVSILSVGGSLQVVGVTELDSQRFKGTTSSDGPDQWDVNFNTSGALFVNTGGTPTDTVWGAVVTKQTSIDVNSGALLG